MLGNLVIPEVTLPLLGILGLLVIWQYHQSQVLAGRIYALDFWDVPGIRMFMHVTANDGRACRHCREANGTVLLPSVMTNKGFSALDHPCTAAGGCRCLVVGLYGGWPEAERLLNTLRRQPHKKPYKLSKLELLELLDGPWQRSLTSLGDRLTVKMIQAFVDELKLVDHAINGYRTVIDQARGARDLRLLVPAYLRATELMEQTGRHEAALALVARFEKRFPPKRKAFYYPSDGQRAAMSARKIRLLDGVSKTRALLQGARSHAAIAQHASLAATLEASS